MSKKIGMQRFILKVMPGGQAKNLE